MRDPHHSMTKVWQTLEWLPKSDKYKEWKELRSKRGNSDAELVSKISNAILRPLPFSKIR